ncbi:MAG: transposase [Pyrinomonadaceae bacterium]
MQRCLPIQFAQKYSNTSETTPRKREIYLDFIGGYTDHVHCLILLGSGQEIENIVRLVKGESSHWVNKNNLTRGKFGWQDEYVAVSVSPSLVPGVRR